MLPSLGLSEIFTIRSSDPQKKIYFQKQLADNQKNLRKTWQILFSTINKNTKKSNIIPHLTVNGLDIEDQLSMACHFNKFFSKIATKTVSNINISNKDPTGLNSFRFSDKNLTKEEVLEATKLLLDKKTPDYTGVSSNFIKQTISVIVNPLIHVLKLSLNTGVVPSQFKIAKVIPILKAGEKTQWIITDPYLC